MCCCCHDGTTLPALADYHERPRRTLTTRRAGDRTGMLAESHSPVETVGGRLFVASRGSYDKAGYVGMGWTVWSVMASLWVDAPTQACPPPPAAHQLGRADKNETVTREGIGITFLGVPWRLFSGKASDSGGACACTCHERVAPARKSPMRVRQMVEHSGDP